MKNLKFVTSSGSVYEIRDGSVRRINRTAEKRADGEWVKLLEPPVVKKGFQVVLVTEPLECFGPDDSGDWPTQPDNRNLYYSTRITTPVIYIEYQEE